jgi:hypothetical protein
VARREGSPRFARDRQLRRHACPILTCRMQRNFDAVRRARADLVERADPSGGVEKQLEQALSQGLELEEWKSLSTIQAAGTANTLRARFASWRARRAARDVQLTSEGAHRGGGKPLLFAHCQRVSPETQANDGAERRHWASSNPRCWVHVDSGRLISIGAITASAAIHVRANDADCRTTIFVVERYSCANTTKRPIALRFDGY